MKIIGIILFAIIGGFILFIIVAPGLRLHTEVIYTRDGVRRLEELRVEALKGDISQAASSLKRATEFWPSKLRHDGELAPVYEASKASVIREIIIRMRSVSGEDLGEAPEPWIEKYFKRKQHRLLFRKTADG